MARILFIHRYFPAQYQHLAAALARDPANQVVFVARIDEGSLEGVERRTYRPTRQPGPETHRYLLPLEDSVLEGQAVYRACQDTSH